MTTTMSSGARGQRRGNCRPVHNKKTQPLTTTTKLSILDSDSDSDEDDNLLLLSQTSTSTVGSKVRKPPPSSPVTTVESPPDDEELERRAREKIASRPFLIDCAKEAKYTVRALLWHVSSTKDRKKQLYHPCRKCKNDDAIGLNLPARRPGQILVAYVGDNLKDAGTLNYVSVSQLKPLVDPDNPRTIVPETMEKFLKSLPFLMKQPTKAGEVLERCILEAAVEECWNQQPQQPKVPTTITIVDAPEENSTAPTRSMNAIQEMEEDDNNESAQDEEESDDDDEKATHPTTATRKKSWDPNDDDDDDKPKKQTLRKGCIIQYHDPTAVAGAGELLQALVVRVTPQRTEVFKLHLNNGTMLRREDRVKLWKKVHRGKLCDNEHAKIQAISMYHLQATTKQEENDNGWVGNQKVEKFKALLEGHAQDVANHPETAFCSDLLRTTGTTSSAKSKKRSVVVSKGEVGSDDEKTEVPKKKKAKQRRKTISSKPFTKPEKSLSKPKQDKPAPAKEEIPKKKQSKQRRKTISSSPSSKHDSASRKSKMDKTGDQPEARFVIPEDWWKNTSKTKLEKEIQVVQGTRRKGSCHLSVESLQCLLDVRQRLYFAVKDSGGKPSVTTILEGIVSSYEPEQEDGDNDDDDECPFTHNQLINFVSGDPKKLVTKELHDPIRKELEKWMAKVDSEGGSHVKPTSTMEVAKDNNPRPRKVAKPTKDSGKPPRNDSTNKKRRASVAPTNATVRSRGRTKQNRTLATDGDGEGKNEAVMEAQKSNENTESSALSPPIDNKVEAQESTEKSGSDSTTLIQPIDNNKVEAQKSNEKSGPDSIPLSQPIDNKVEVQENIEKSGPDSTAPSKPIDNKVAAVNVHAESFETDAPKPEDTIGPSEAQESNRPDSTALNQPIDNKDSEKVHDAESDAPKPKDTAEHSCPEITPQISSEDKIISDAMTEPDAPKPKDTVDPPEITPQTSSEDQIVTAARTEGPPPRTSTGNNSADTGTQVKEGPPQTSSEEQIVSDAKTEGAPPKLMAGDKSTGTDTQEKEGLPGELPATVSHESLETIVTQDEPLVAIPSKRQNENLNQKDKSRAPNRRLKKTTPPLASTILSHQEQAKERQNEHLPMIREQLEVLSECEEANTAAKKQFRTHQKTTPLASTTLSPLEQAKERQREPLAFTTLSPLPPTKECQSEPLTSTILSPQEQSKERQNEPLAFTSFYNPLTLSPLSQANERHNEHRPLALAQFQAPSGGEETTIPMTLERLEAPAEGEETTTAKKQFRAHQRSSLSFARADGWFSHLPSNH